MNAIAWDRDDRRATLRTRLYVLGMRLARDKKAFSGAEHTLQTARKLQRRGNRPPTLLTRVLCRVSSDTAQMTVWTVSPRRRRPVVRVVYLHGGGYIHPLTGDYWRLVRALASVPAEVVVPAYSLSPAANVDEVLPQLIELVLSGRDDRPTLVMGDSAGGALAIVIAQQLRARSGRLSAGAVAGVVAGVVALCPWLDATLDEQAVGELQSTDPMLAVSGLRAAGRWWAGHRSPTDPLISPVAGDLNGLPPLDVFIGDHDILRPAVDDLARHARHTDLRLHVHETTAMFHVWMTRLIPEGRRTRAQLVALARRRAGEAPSAAQE